MNCGADFATVGALMGKDLQCIRLGKKKQTAGQYIEYDAEIVPEGFLPKGPLWLLWWQWGVGHETGEKGPGQGFNYIV